LRSRKTDTPPETIPAAFLLLGARVSQWRILATFGDCWSNVFQFNEQMRAGQSG
jgi:hypothetical protein